MTLREDFEQLKYKLGLQLDIDCTEAENDGYRALIKEGKPLPEGVLCRNPEASPEYAAFYTVKGTDLSKEELDAYLQYKQLKSIITIKNCVVFFTVLTVISMVGALLIEMGAF